MTQRYVVLLACMIIQLCLGGVYAWAVFVPFLREAHGLSMAQTQAIFGTAIGAFALATIPAGRLLPHTGPRVLAGVSGLLFAGGGLLAAHSGGHFWLLWLAMGVITGGAIGCGYVCPLSLCVQWFPRCRGLATGLAVGSFGAGGVVQAGLAEWLLDAGWGPLHTLGTIGLAYGMLILAAGLVLAAPSPQALSPASVVPPGLLTDRRFRLAVLGIFCGTFAGLLVIGNLKPIGLAGGIGPALCTVAVSVFALGNATGRLVWGWIFDRVGPRSIPLSLASLAGTVLLLYPASLREMLFVPICALAGFGFGACFVLYAAYVAAEYGSDRVARIYPLVFAAYGLSGVVSPPIGGWLFDTSGSYLVAMLLAAAIALAGAIGTAVMLSAVLRRRMANLMPE